MFSCFLFCFPMDRNKIANILKCYTYIYSKNPSAAMATVIFVSWLKYCSVTLINVPNVCGGRRKIAMWQHSQSRVIGLMNVRQ
jgi:hypothetical protein